MPVYLEFTGKRREHLFQGTSRGPGQGNGAKKAVLEGQGQGQEEPEGAVVRVLREASRRPRKPLRTSRSRASVVLRQQEQRASSHRRPSSAMPGQPLVIL